MDASFRMKRIKAGLSQKQVSMELGIPIRTIEDWDAGIRRPSPWIENLLSEKMTAIALKKHTYKGKDQGIYMISEIRELVTPVFTEYGVQSAVLFGSYAMGSAQENSDIDICVETDLHGSKLYELQEDLTAVLDKKVDLIPEYRAKKNIDLYSEIKKIGIKLFDGNQ